MEISSKAINASSEEGLIKSLLKRRVPQIVGIYLGSAWTLFGVLQWAVNRYVLSPHLEELFLLAALLFLPALIIVAYGHGAPGKDAWKKYEVIGLSCNALAAIALLTFIFWGKDLGSAQKTVSIVDTEGNEIEQVIPKAEFRKRIAMFYFENASGNNELDWMQQAIPTIWSSDLTQDLFITTNTTLVFKNRLTEAGFEDGLNLPMALKRNITTDYNLSYFLSGAIDEREDNLVLTTTLTEAESGKQVTRHEYVGDDIFELVDQMTVELKNDLDLPQRHIEETVDLPAKEMLTSSIPALKAYDKGYLTMYFDNDFPGALPLLQEATQMDPTFAMAYVQQYIALLQSGQIEQALQAHATAQKHGYRLTEQFKYLLKVGKLNLSGNHVQALEALKQWATLYPDDKLAFQFLGMLHSMRSEFDLAVDAYSKLLELDPFESQISLELGRALKAAKRQDEAIAHFESFIQQYPEKNEGYNELAGIYSDQGNLDKELEIRQKAQSTTPDDPNTLLNLATVHRRLGNFDEAVQLYNQALSLSQLPQDQLASHRGLGGYYWFRGQHQQAIESFEKAQSVIEQNFPPTSAIVNMVQNVSEYYEAGYQDKARDIAEEAWSSPLSQTYPNMSVYSSSALSHVYASEGRFEEALAALDQSREFIESSNFTIHLVDLLPARASVYKKSGQFEEARATYEELLDIAPSSISGWYNYGFVLHELGEYKEAKESFETALTISPFNPMALLGLGKTELALGNAEEARPHLERALSVWENSDDTNKPFLEVQNLLASL